MSSANNVSLETLFEYFPEVELPITFSEDLVNTADSVNKVLPAKVIEQFIVPWENSEIDEFTEFVPVLKLKGPEEFHALVYWKGGLMQYEYILVTLDKSGELIARRPIASTLSDGKTVKKSVAQIDEDLIIHIMAGANLANEEYDPNNSQAFNMEILFTGDIIFSLGDD